MAYRNDSNLIRVSLFYSMLNTISSSSSIVLIPNAFLSIPSKCSHLAAL